MTYKLRRSPSTVWRVAIIAFMLGSWNFSRADPLQLYPGPAFAPYYPAAIGGVTDSGIAIGVVPSVVGPGNFWVRNAWRWDGAGTIPVQLASYSRVSDGVADESISDVSPNGTAVGIAQQYDSARNPLGYGAVRWDAFALSATNLGGLGGGAVNAINAAGIGVGDAVLYNGTGDVLGFGAARWEPSSQTPVLLQGLEPGDHGGPAFDINDSGLIVGVAGRSDGLGNSLGYRAVRWIPGLAAPQELGHLGTDLQGSTAARALRVNASGTTIGDASEYDAAGNFVRVRSVLWNSFATDAIPLSGLTAESSTNAVDINDDGTVIGSSLGAGPGWVAVRWEAGQTQPEMLSLLDGDATSDVHAINSSGIAVGYSAVPDEGDPLFNPARRAVLWHPDGLVVDLNDLIDAASGWTLLDAQAISDSGWIAGTAMFDSGGQALANPEYRLFLLQIPEPTGVGWLVLILIALRRVPHKKG